MNNHTYIYAIHKKIRIAILTLKYNIILLAMKKGNPMNNATNKSETKTALIIGCNGTFGNAVGLELLNQGWRVKALLRNSNKKPGWLADSDIHIGNCESFNEVQKAAEDVDLLVYAANPLYNQWPEKAEKMMEPTIKIAEINAIHILFPGNVYGYNPLLTPSVNEQSKPDPVTDKGRIRIAMEQRLQRAAQNNATVTVIRAGDFIAKDADSSWFNQLLTKRGRAWSLSNPSPQGHRHCYAWLPDLAANAVAVLALDKQGFNVWHESGVVASHQDWLNTMTKLGLKVKSKTLPWWLLKVVGLFNPIIKEVVKMRYLWQQSLVLDGSKMQTVLGGNYRSSSLTDIVTAMTSK